MSDGSLFTTAWRVLRLRMDETASSYGGQLLNKQMRTEGGEGGLQLGGWAWGLSVGLTPPHRKKISCHEMSQKASELHNEELRNLYSSPSIIKMIKSRSLNWARHGERMRAKRNSYKKAWREGTNRKTKK
jgi:hypothetical protein